MDDLTPHLGNIVGEIVDLLTLAEIGIRSLTIHLDSTTTKVLIFPIVAGRRATIDDARRTIEALGGKAKVSDPYSTPPQVNITATVTLAGQPVDVTVIADPDGDR